MRVDLFNYFFIILLRSLLHAYCCVLYVSQLDLLLVCLYRFQGLAIRLEDNILLTATGGAEVINNGTPQDIGEITNLMNTD